MATFRHISYPILVSVLVFQYSVYSFLYKYYSNAEGKGEKIRSCVTSDLGYCMCLIGLHQNITFYITFLVVLFYRSLGLWVGELMRKKLPYTHSSIAYLEQHP